MTKIIKYKSKVGDSEMNEELLNYLTPFLYFLYIFN